MKKLLLLFTASFALCMQAQTTIQPILLTNQTVSVESQDIRAFNISKGEEVEGHIYRIIQSSALNMLSGYAGMQVLEYIPKNAYLVSIPAANILTFQKIALQNQIITLRIDPTWKLSRKLFQQNIPEWAWLDNSHFKLWVNYYSNLDANFVKSQLASLGYNIIDENPTENLLAISITPEEVNDVATLAFLSHLQEMEDPGHPENLTERTDHRVNYLQANYPGAPGYDGTGVVVGHGDDGELGNHIDYKGRLTQSAGVDLGDHGDHVAGTIFGAGNRDPRARGMAPGAEIYYQSYPQNLSNADINYASKGVRITSSSYSNGCNAGYTNFTRQMDQDAIDDPTLIHVFSAGNNGSQDCGYGAGNGWGNITGGHKIAKNVITVANVTRTDDIAPSSSRGPASDGRIKPDVSAVGTNVYSTTDIPSPNSYTTKTGTSMSCPGVSGSLATLYQAFKETQGHEPSAGLLKAILMNTCDDLGNPGPDFEYGYGRINARAAAEDIAAGRFITDSITNTSKTLQIPLPTNGTVKEVKIMLYWPDAPASTFAARALVNDLDLSVSQNSNTYQPWVLDPTPNPANLNANAVRGRDSLNNIEQVTIENPGSGNLTVHVDPYNLPSGGQKFFITYSFVMDSVILTYPVGGEGFVPNEVQVIRWDAPAGTGNFSLQYSADAGNSWNTISSSVSAGQRYFNWTVPNIATDSAMVKITRASKSSQSLGTFTIVKTPASLSVVSSCPDSLVLSWDTVSGATAYEVYRLGAKYMDSIATTTQTSIKIPRVKFLTSNWFSVAAIVNHHNGRRATAIENQAGIYNCTFQKDLIISELIWPMPGIITDCVDLSSVPVKAVITNAGLKPLFGFDVSYRFNNGTIIKDTITDTIQPGAKLIHTFSGSPISLNAGSNYYFDLWVNSHLDENHFNDTLTVPVIILNGTSKSIPYFQNFEDFTLCSTSGNCGGTTCNLSDGWINEVNYSLDDIDWRVQNGPTLTPATGPAMDHNPAAPHGKYLYLESSGSCDSSKALLLPPCLDLDSTVANNAELDFWYHMNGSSMGKLSVDLITDNGLMEKIIPTVSGNKGNQWIKASINLDSYLGQKVLLRIIGKTGNGETSDLAIDDFRLFDPSQAAPQANGEASDSMFCSGDTIVFSDLSNGMVSNYQWDFGPGAVPATANTAGPHSVTYTSAGSKIATLHLFNVGGTSFKNLYLDVNAQPNAAFSYNTNILQVSFNDLSQNNPTRWHWEFGDGDTSNLINPTHSYASDGTYIVSLTVSNECGSKTSTRPIAVGSGIGMEEMGLSSLTLFPNPNTGRFTIELPQNIGNKVEIIIYELSGKLVWKTQSSVPANGLLDLDATTLPEGIYLVKVKTSRASRNLRMVKQH